MHEFQMRSRPQVNFAEVVEGILLKAVACPSDSSCRHSVVTAYISPARISSSVVASAAGELEVRVMNSKAIVERQYRSVSQHESP